MLARVNQDYIITIPPEIRRLLRIKPGDKIQFTQNEAGEIILTNASAEAIPKAQAAFAGAAEALGVQTEEDIQALVDEVRYGSRS